MQDADNQEVRIGTDRVCASTVGPKVATPCQAQLHAERVFLHGWTQCRDTMLNTLRKVELLCHVAMEHTGPMLKALQI